MKVWITKYALTHGIEEKEAVRCTDVNEPDMIKIVTNKYGEYYCGEGDEWHSTRESAVAKAEKMREKKLKSLRKSLEKVQNIKF